jgi:hypothetical protein
MIILVKSGKEDYGAFSCDKKVWSNVKKQKKGLWRAAPEERQVEFRSVPNVKYVEIGSGVLKDFAIKNKLPNWKDYFTKYDVPDHVKSMEVFGKFFNVKHECTSCGKVHKKQYQLSGISLGGLRPLCNKCSNKAKGKVRIKKSAPNRSSSNPFQPNRDHGYNICGQVHSSVHDAFNNSGFTDNWANQYGSGVKELSFDD